jgi:riboflavin kinase/FMN adenylyltransferase
MRLVSGIALLESACPHPVVCIGNFDGVHLGHRAIIDLARDNAMALSGTVVAYTFKPHPHVVLRPQSEIQLLTTYEERAEFLAAAGVDIVVEEPFIREFSTTGYEQFFTDHLLRGLNAEKIIVGYDFAFGRAREGHLEALRTLCKDAGVELIVAQAMRQGREVVSSSCIRHHCRLGELEAAAGLMGRPFFYRGVVMRGDGRGRQIGFPTANIAVGSKLVLPFGVYATQTLVGEEVLPSVTNVGLRPTFLSDKPDVQPLVETYIIDREFDLYGVKIEVRFLRRLRGEMKFDGVESLKRQIADDIAAARMS